MFGAGFIMAVAVHIGLQVNAGSPLIGKTVKSMSFWLWKGNSPTGNGFMKIIDGHGFVKANSTNTISWSGLGTSSWGTQQTFNFNGHKIRECDCFLITGGTTNDTNRVNISMGTSEGNEVSAHYWNNDDRRGYHSTPVKYEITYGNSWTAKGEAA